MLVLCSSLCVVLQTSPESPGIYLLLQRVFRGQSLEKLKSAAEGNGVSADQFQVCVCVCVCVFCVCVCSVCVCDLCKCSLVTIDELCKAL